MKTALVVLALTVAGGQAFRSHMDLLQEAAESRQHSIHEVTAELDIQGHGLTSKANVSSASPLLPRLNPEQGSTYTFNVEKSFSTTRKGMWDGFVWTLSKIDDTEVSPVKLDVDLKDDNGMLKKHRILSIVTRTEPSERLFHVRESATVISEPKFRVFDSRDKLTFHQADDKANTLYIIELMRKDSVSAYWEIRRGDAPGGTNVEYYCDIFHKSARKDKDEGPIDGLRFSCSRDQTAIGDLPCVGVLPKASGGQPKRFEVYVNGGDTALCNTMATIILWPGVGGVFK